MRGNEDLTAEEHWFDRFNKALVRPAPRRTLLHSARALAAGLSLGATPWPGAAKQGKGKGKGKRKRKRKRKEKPNPVQTCSGGACAAAWPGDQGQINYCEFICQQCDADDPREFCIIEGDPNDPAKVAVCCPPGAPCCGEDCCPDLPGIKCCPPDGCFQTNSNRQHCGDCFRQCLSDEICRDGECRGCLGRVCDNECFDPDDDLHCGSCGNRCARDEDCVGGVCVFSDCGGGLTRCPPAGCVDTQSNPAHCGRCNDPCNQGALRYCVHGQCGCNPASDNVPCGTNCIPSTYACCPGNIGCSHQCGANGGCA